MRYKIKKRILILIVMQILMLTIPIRAFANTVEYKGEAEGLITTPDDFFLNFGELLPGDTEEDEAYIINSTNDEIEVFFRAEPLSRSEYYDDVDYSLLEEITLKISLKQTSNAEEQVLYEGNLGAESMSEYISLGTYQKGYDGEFIFKIEVSTSLRNKYTLSSTKVKWIFAVERKNKDIDDDKITQAIKTGDSIYYAVFALIIAVLVTTIIIYKKHHNGKTSNISK